MAVLPPVSRCDCALGPQTYLALSANSIVTKMTHIVSSATLFCRLFCDDSFYADIDGVLDFNLILYYLHSD